MQNFSEKREINLKKTDFFLEKTSNSKRRRYFSFLEKNVFILIQKNEGISLKIFQVKEEINFLWKYENNFCELAWGYSTNFKTSKTTNGSYIFFLNSILVPPTRFRPVDLSQLKNSQVQVFSNPQNFYFVRMLKLNQQLLLAIGTEKKIFSENWGIKSYFELEKELSNFCDNISFSSSKDKEKPIGIRQQLEKKMGLFRMHLMGKRVFHSARSIITPDPFLEGNEVGVPLSFSSRLTVPDPLNFFSLKKKIFEKRKNPKNFTLPVKNFHSFQTIFGKKILSINPRSELGKAQFVDICFKYFNRNHNIPSPFFGLNKIFRHLKNKDIVLLNRQPSLHKVSIMAHKVRVLPGSKCIRIHYANCNSYNADFDGDEMNLHFPQNCMAKTEGVFLSLASNQGKVPTDNLPIRGLIQDHIISSVFLTSKDTFFNQKIFSQLLCCFKNFNPSGIHFPCPSILKPKILWTGKQLISKFWEMISVKSIDFFLESRTKTTSLSLGNDETKVLIRKGQLLRGILDGSQLGKNKHGVLNALFEVFGSLLANNFLHGFSCLLTFFQRICGHTTSLDDLILLKKIDKHRIRVFNREKKISRFYLRKILSKKGISFIPNSIKIQKFFLFTRIVAFLCSQRVLLSQLIISIKNILSRIFSKNVENCIPGSLEKNFLSNGFSKMTISGAKGSLVNTLQVSLSLGQTELEGRCIPRGISGKTLPCFPPFDTSSRSNGYISQRFLTGISQSDFFFHCMAGREGLLDTAVKTSQSGYIQRSIIKHLESHSVHYDFSTRFGKGNLTQLVYSNNGLIYPLKEVSSLTKWFLQNSNLFPSRSFPILNSIKKYEGNQIFWYFTHRFPYTKEIQKIIGEFFFSRKNFFHEKRPKGEKNLFFWAFTKNFFEPGEPIGLITGQSLGEPCTQMTLNTFHFAGKLVSSGNVGISRLKEVLLTASKRLKNPTMSAKLKKNLPNDSLSFVEKRFKTIFLSDLIELVSFHIEKSHGIDFVLFRIKFCTKNLFKHQLALTKRMILKKFQTFWEKLKSTSKLFKNTQFFLKKKNNQKNKKKPFYFSKFNRLAFKDKVFKKLKENKKKSLNFLIDGILGSEFCIRDLPRISNCFLDLEEKSIHIQGINFFALWHFQDIIEINKIFCSDIFGAMITYGIEGARNFIFNELQTIFRFQAISVAKRHLDLASDYMTRLGNYRAFNRQGLREESGFQKITYETAVRFIIENAIYKNSDDLSSVSSCVGLGKTCTVGTGSFDLILPKG